MTAARRRIAFTVAGALAAILAFSACSAVASSDGQQRLDDALSAAGLTGLVTAKYSCTGALPGKVDHCNKDLTITADDRDVVDRAAAIPQLADARMELSYRGVNVISAPANIQVVWTVLDAAPAGLPISSVDADTPEQPKVWVADNAPVLDGCALLSAARSADSDIARISVSGRQGDTTWGFSAASRTTPEVLATACTLVDDFLTAGDLRGVDDIDVDEQPATELIEVSTDTPAAAARVSAWFAARPDAQGFTVRVR